MNCRKRREIREERGKKRLGEDLEKEERERIIASAMDMKEEKKKGLEREG